MNQLIFTAEEENFICIFDTSSRAALIDGIRASFPDLNEPKMREIAENVLKKLNDIDDAEYSGMIFSPAYYDDEREV